MASENVALLLTDIEGSTKLWDTQPDVMSPAVARHDEIIEGVVTAHGGRLIKNRGEGDSTFSAFDVPSAAVRAAAEIQLALQKEVWAGLSPVMVRAAVHVGEAELRGDDYFGDTVNRCARLRAAGYGGQTLLSGVCADLVREKLGDELSLRPLGLHRLKGLKRPERIFQLVIPELPEEFPALSTQGSVGGLPFDPLPFVGRAAEIDELRTMLLDPTARIVTVLGTGGAGKTRLALLVAEMVAGEFEDGSVFVGLGALSEPALVPNAVAQGLGLQDLEGRPVDLVSVIGGSRRLLVMDNFEHLLEARAFVANLITSCPRLVVLATSRAPLQIRVEREFKLGSMNLPGATVTDVEAARAFESISLFESRAKAVRRDFILTPENLQDVSEICRRLDGLPLAIELAASRLKIFETSELLSRLTERVDALGRGPLDAPERQRTLESAVDWSYRLLSPRDQRGFSRLGVFWGSFGSRSALAITALEEDEGIELLENLIDNSLLRRTEAVLSEARFEMLQTIRDFTLKRLSESGDEEAIRSSHAGFFLMLAEATNQDMAAPQRDRSFLRLEADEDNMRAALRFFIDHRQSKEALRLAGALSWFWYFRGRLAEGRGWIADALTLPGADDSPVEKMRALIGYARLLRYLNDFPAAKMAAEEAVQIGRIEGERRDLAHALIVLGLALMGTSEAQAVTVAEESVAIFEALEDPWGLAISHFYLGVGSFVAGRADLVKPALEESLGLFRTLDDDWGVGGALFYLGLVRLGAGDRPGGRELVAESVERFRRGKDRWRLSLALKTLASMMDDEEDAARVRGEAMELEVEIGTAAYGPLDAPPPGKAD